MLGTGSSEMNKTNTPPPAQVRSVVRKIQVGGGIGHAGEGKRGLGDDGIAGHGLGPGSVEVETP